MPDYSRWIGRLLQWQGRPILLTSYYHDHGSTWFEYQFLDDFHEPIHMLDATDPDFMMGLARSLDEHDTTLRSLCGEDFLCARSFSNGIRLGEFHSTDGRRIFCLSVAFHNTDTATIYGQVSRAEYEAMMNLPADETMSRHQSLSRIGQHLLCVDYGTVKGIFTEANICQEYIETI